MNYIEEYKSKLVSADRAVKAVKSGDWLDYGCLCAQVAALDEALAKRKDELSEIKIWTLLTLSSPQILEVDPRGDTFIINSWHFSELDRRTANAGTPIYYSPIRYSELPRYISENIETINVAMRQVCPMDKHGYFNFGHQNSHSKAVCNHSKKVIVEINENLPRCLGGYGEAIHISEVDMIVEGNNPSIPEIKSPPPKATDEKIAALIVDELQDGCCIQLGIGGLPHAVGQMIAESDLKNLGCHTEMLSDAYVDMFESGKITGIKKNIDPGKMVYSFALGTRLLYDYLDDNPTCASYPVDYTNKPSIAARNDNLITVNNAIQVDLYGQICSESLGIRQISGTGGQLDFVLAAYKSQGGKSFICLPSVKTDINGELISTIVPTLTEGTIITVPRSTAQFIVTEYGKFNLKGKSVWQRTEGLIKLAHPDFRDKLIKAAAAQGIWRKSNKINS